MAVGAVPLTMLSAPDILKVPLHVSQHHQIQTPIIVQINPRRARIPGHTRSVIASGSRTFRNICKRAVSVVVVQMVPSVSGDIEVLIAVVVVVANRNAHVIPDTFQTSSLSNVLERSILALVVQPVPVLRRTLLRDRSLLRGIIQRRSIHKEQIEAAIIVIVKDGNS